MPKPSGFFVTTIESCPRCTKAHDGAPIFAHALTYTTSTGFTHWLMCPFYGEPVFVVRVSDGNLDVEHVT